MIERAREAARSAFLAAAGWGDAVATPLPGDASTRHYARLTLAGRQAMLMDQPQDAEAASVPMDADAGARQALGYNAVARLAGADCRRFRAVSDYLAAQGFSAPRIYAADEAQGFLILEDLGDALFADVLADGGDEELLYRAAVEVLAKIHAHAAPTALAPGVPLFSYDVTALIAETDLLTQWFLPLALGRDARPDEVEEHRALWRTALAPLGATQPVFVHRDYHAQNLLWLPKRAGVARVGLIDFQDAVAGHPVYDLVSLIEDARRDVGPELREVAAAHYLDVMVAQGTALDGAHFHHAMAVMAAQRNSKIVGIFARLAMRDGKRRYLDMLPRVWAYLAHDLSHPALSALRAWHDRVLPPGRRALVAP